MNNRHAPATVRLAHGRGRLYDQPATFTVAGDGAGRGLWVARTADGRAETAIVEPGAATAASWNTGVRHTLELEALAHQLRVVHALLGAEPGERALALASIGGTQRLELGPTRTFAGGLALPGSARMAVEGQPEWECTIDEATATADWAGLRRAAEAAGRAPAVSWTDAGVAPLETRLVPATGHLLVRLRLHGTDGWFLLDTGAEELVVLPAFAEQAALPRAGTRPLSSIAGVERAAVVELGDIVVGPLTIAGTAGVVSEALATLPAALGTAVDGVIGAHLFGHAVISMDLVAGRVTIAPTGPADLAWTPVRLQNLHPLVEAGFEGRRGLFRLDTGAVPGVLFHAAAVRAHGLLEGRTTAPVPTDGVLELRAGRLARLELGGARLDDVDALFATGSGTVLSDTVTVGLVGIPVLRRFSLVIDLAGRRIALTPRA